MASANYKGAGFNVSDWVLIAGLAVGGYFLWKTFFKPTSEITGATGELVAEVGDTGKSLLDVYQAGLGKIEEGIKNINVSSNKKSSSGKINNITQVSAKNYVTSVTDAGSAYSQPLVTVKTSTGQSSTIAATKSTYYPTLGIGYDTKGAGYSSMTPLKR